MTATIMREKLTSEEAAKLWPDWCFWPGSTFERYAHNWCRRHFWRVRTTVGTFDDAMQVCAENWVYCRNKCANNCNSPAQFMAIFKLALVQSFNTISVHDSKRRQIEVADVEDFGLQTDHNLGPALIQLSEASSELKSVLQILADAPSEVLEFMLGSHSSDLNTRRCMRLLGLPIAHNIFAELKKLFSST